MTLKTSQIEVGNGITTGFLQVLAEELNMDMDQMHYGNFNKASLDVVDTYVAVSSGGEGGSNAMSGTGPKIRAAGAIAYQALLGMASTKLGVPASALSVKSGVVSGGGRSVTYGQLVGGQLLNLPLTPATALNPGVAPAKPIANYTMVTIPNTVQRIDIPAKVTGSYTYVQNVRVPGMLHGRIVRPRGQGALPVQLGRSGQRRCELDRAHPGREGRPGRELPRRRRAAGVRRDPGGGAAEGRLEPEHDPPGRRQPLEPLPPARRGGSDPGGDLDERRQLHRGARIGGAHGERDVQVPLPGPHADRAQLRARRRHPDGATIYSNTQNVESLVTDLVNVLSPLTGIADPRALLRGLGHLRQRLRAPSTRPSRPRSCRRRSERRCGCSSCAGTSTAGRTTGRRS